jgi:hypothetical protein
MLPVYPPCLERWKQGGFVLKTFFAADKRGLRLGTLGEAGGNGPIFSRAAPGQKRQQGRRYPAKSGLPPAANKKNLRKD